MSEKINFPEFQKWLIGKEIDYATSTRERKKLSCTLNGCYVVRINGVIVYEGIQAYKAIEKYNEITEKFNPNNQ